MHLIYRSKKQALPIVNDPKLAPYDTHMNCSPTNTIFARKKSIDVIIEKHKNPSSTINDQLLIYQKASRKTSYRPQKTRKAESGYLKNTDKADLSQVKLEHKLLPRNKSTELNQKLDSFYQRRKVELDSSPYKVGQYKKSRSNSKFRSAQEVTDHSVGVGVGAGVGRDWICEQFIEKQVYGVEQWNDFI